jgi:hypothetical protein
MRASAIHSRWDSEDDNDELQDHPVVESHQPTTMFRASGLDVSSGDEERPSSPKSPQQHEQPTVAPKEHTVSDLCYEVNDQVVLLLAGEGPRHAVVREQGNKRIQVTALFLYLFLFLF